ncbi:LysR family transcriptional regulator [Roseateles asaccharophilus]|uniref:DNA-binding transcriptional LysR family regulator n=1 Tax=Roseateles asaccharophilus TaxID=582607 RepID=A0ABU2AB08_9BURK|nr:LysR family transcriptional regulator [Roseateles asaccharophilus]MDR7334386.1 DNA-binding transcriptional LysR family regulator [Roseateles asaccharophilus]
MSDLNLLLTLDALLTEGSVAGAARRLRLSPSAMSRSLARLREATGDPLLVRAGRGLVPSPRALELRERIGPLVQEAQAALRPADALKLDKLEREFTLRTREGFVENFGAALLARMASEAPGVRLRFVPKSDRDSGPLRDGSVDLETGVIGSTMGPELRTQALFRDRFVAVVRDDHALARGRLTAKRYAAGRHVAISRRGTAAGPIDDALSTLGLSRDIAVTVAGFAEALALARGMALIATVPERHTGHLRAGLTSLALPLALEPFTVSLLWHPRMEGDAAHRWLRGCVRDVCTAQPASVAHRAPSASSSR